MSAAADQWLTTFLGIGCRLVHMPDEVVRPVRPDYAFDGERTSFTDGFPFLLISEASLDDLNGRLAAPIPMNRFRPNLVVAGAEPFAEDRWRADPDRPTYVPSRQAVPPLRDDDGRPGAGDLAEH